ncbi:MAG TPA: DUF3887 domain-containing protein [Anaerolineaceae bacterium]|jgi:hypothetical protein
MVARPRKIKLALTGIILLLLALLSTACTPDPPKTLTGAEKDAVLGYSEKIADNLLSGYNSADYATFALDMNDTMKKTLTEDYFKKNIIGSVFSKVGKYESRTVESVLQTRKYVTVVYNAKFSGDDPVVVRVSLDPAGAHQISGLWFDSVNLRK